MIKNSVIIIPNVSDEDQVCDFLQKTAKILRQDNHVYVFNYFSTPGILPFRRFSLIANLNRILYLIFLQIYLSIKHKDAKRFYWWVFFPQLSMLSSIKLPGWKLIFDIVDYHFSPLTNEHKILEQQKIKLLEKADYVFSISQTLKCLYQPISKLEIKIVPQGFDLENFSKFNKQSKIKLPHGKPIIGFIGQISERLDFELINNLIKQNKEWNFVFVGPWHHEVNVPRNTHYQEFFSKVCKENNCFHYQKQAKNNILSILNQFDICMIPYNSSFEFNKYSYPMKIFEYFYAGKPVLSTPIKELERFNDFVRIGKNSKDWQSHIRQILKKPWSYEKSSSQKQISIENSWQNKLDKIYEFIKEKH